MKLINAAIVIANKVLETKGPNSAAVVELNKLQLVAAAADVRVSSGGNPCQSSTSRHH